MRLDPRVKERLKKTFTDELTAQKELVKIISTIPLSVEEQKKILLQFPQYAESTV